MFNALVLAFGIISTLVIIITFVIGIISVIKGAINNKFNPE